MSQQYRIYLDVCCLSRPLDDSYQSRIRLEAEAVLSIYEKCRLGEWILVSSDVIDAELRQTPENQKIEFIQEALAIAKERASLDSSLKQRARELVALGFKAFDAAHIASAEAMKVDVLLTTDDRLQRRASRHQSNLHVTISNPVTWLISLSPYEGDNTDENPN